jgi:hypothetical protein
LLTFTGCLVHGRFCTRPLLCFARVFVSITNFTAL